MKKSMTALWSSLLVHQRVHYKDLSRQVAFWSRLKHCPLMDFWVWTGTPDLLITVSETHAPTEKRWTVESILCLLFLFGFFFNFCWSTLNYNLHLSSSFTGKGPIPHFIKVVIWGSMVYHLYCFLLCHVHFKLSFLSNPFNGRHIVHHQAIKASDVRTHYLPSGVFFTIQASKLK